MTATWDTDVDLTVEIAPGDGPFATPTWVDISAFVRAVTTTRDTSVILDEVQAGVMTVTLDNTDSRFDPNNTSGPYTPDLGVGTPIRVFAVHNTITYDLWRGFATGWPQEYPGIADSVVVVPCVDGFRYLAMFEEELTESEELSGTRIGNLLDTVGWPAGSRDIDTGSHTIAAITAEFGTALDEIRQAVLVEQGLFWIAGDGDATFRDATTRIQDRTVQATFSDDGADLSYSFPQIPHDDSQLWNNVRVTREDGTEQTASDSTSITNHGQADLHLSNTLHVADGEALALADWLVNEYAEVRFSMTQLVLYPMKDPVNLWPVALGLEFWEMVNVERTPPSSSTIDVNCFVQSISHEITKIGEMRWDTTLQLSADLANGADYWILGTDELGTGTRLGY